ncbi:hypothetical protein AALO_G00069530 [Alosa alosa]|uniref:Hexosyltransferase n=1 Tax=Alosa alosa TaxID=278164 RepID=A0AAV6H7C7_9TELE|nr:chondroitin sulfate N-acetylgalactosaminyltransferase 1-like [Alosa alosa]XP_048099696.1 chondroitin sulfate N-acetylgalactosaminyltransferase 1-like [Alosa alosa]KAG5281291.1 hypothetical protein AALO_G00069530 [Alosa alosa]
MLQRWCLATVTRRGLMLVLTCSGLVLLHLLSCSFKGSYPIHRPSSWANRPVSEPEYQVLLQELEEQYQHYVHSLTKQISQLKEAVAMRSIQLRESLGHSVTEFLPETEGNALRGQLSLEEFLQSQLNRAEVHAGTKVPSEYALVPFESFTLHKVYQLEMGLSRFPVERPLRKDRRHELVSTLETALHMLNAPRDSDDPQLRKVYSPSDFIEGIYRTERDRGTMYELMFKGDGPEDFKRLVFFRPFAPLMRLRDEQMDLSGVLVNIIVPLAKMADKFKRFMVNFRDVCIRQDGKIHLTVVYFGKDQLEEVRKILEMTARETSFKNFTLIQLNEEFSRGRGLDVGARAWKKGNVLMFFCDVDVVFTAEFLNSCRLNAEPGKKVFYPVIFSQFNPVYVYGQHAAVPPTELVMKKDTGYWRDLGFGMTCQYRSDFINIGGFDASTRGWVVEDLHLYRKYLHSELLVVRATSRNLLHLWHPSTCSDDLPEWTYHLCQQRRATSEASHSQLGRLLFRKQIEEHQRLHGL